MDKSSNEVISIKQEQAIQNILNEVPEYGGEVYELDEGIEELLKESQENIAKQYEQMAESRYSRNRMAIHIQDEQDFLHNILDHPIPSPEIHLPIPTQTSHTPSLYILDEYQQQRHRSSIQQEHQISELNRKYPKINHMSMYRHQYPIFQFTSSSTNKYLHHHHIKKEDIGAAVTIKVSNEQKWTIYGVGGQLIAFTRENWKEPMVINLSKQKHVTSLVVSPEKKYVAVGLVNEIVVFMIKKETLVLAKTFPDLRLKRVRKIAIFQDCPLKFSYLDDDNDVGLVTVDETFIFTRVNSQEIIHNLHTIRDLDALTQDNTHFIALLSTRYVCVYKLSSDPQLVAMEELQGKQPSEGVMLVRWRFNEQLTKPQLFISQNQNIWIYKFSNEDEQYSLNLHLQYNNHYHIEQMELISNTHLLIGSQENILIVAIPLIPSTSLHDSYEGCENAIVYIASQSKLKFFDANFDEILYITLDDGVVKCATLRTLPSFMHELMIQNADFYAAFILLILVYKGVNFSFLFSYMMHDLVNCIYLAIETCLSSLIPSMDRVIVEFRVGWMCQLAVQTRQEHLIWGLTYRRLKEKKLLLVLLETLQLFISRSQIKNIPEEIFFHAIQFYCQQGYDYVVEKMILDNKEEYDGEKLLSLIQLNNRHYLQIFLFTKGIVCEEPDFYTPFIKVFSSFKHYYDVKEVGSYEEVAIICFWFLRKCFLFEQIPSGLMTLDEKTSIINKFIIEIIEPVFIKKLSEYNLKLFLETYLLIYIREQLLELIEEENDSLIEKYIKYNNVENQQQTRKKTFLEVLLGHIRKHIQNHKTQFLWYQFQAIAFFYSHCPISFENMIDILIILFQNKFQSYNLYIPPKIAKPSIEKLQTAMINYIKPTLLTKKDKFYMNKLLSFGDVNINYLLHKINHNYKQALEHYLATKPVESLIPFIFDILQDLEVTAVYEDKFFRERKILQIKQFLVKNVTLLFRVDKIQALSLFYAIGETTQTIYSLINDHLGEKIHFLTAVLLKFQHEDFEQKEQFLLENLGQACKLEQSQMLNYLNTFYYPLDKAIIVCEKKGNFLGKAILQERAGYIDGAFKSYQHLVRDLISNKRASEKSIRSDVQRYIEECIRLCKKFSGDNSTQNFWLRIIMFINSFIKSSNQHKIYLKVQFERMLQFVISQMFEFLPTSLLIEFFTINKLELSPARQFDIYGHLFLSIQVDICLFRRVIDVCKLDIKDTRKGALKMRRAGLISNGECDFCKNSLLEEQKSRIYACSHSFHIFCHDDQYKCLTCYYQSEDSIFKSNIFGTQFRRNSFQSVRNHQIDSQKQPQIVVESLYSVRYQQQKKKLKLFDLEQDKQNNKIFQMEIK